MLEEYNSYEDESNVSGLLLRILGLRSIATGQSGLTTTNSHFCRMKYQSMTGISARTNRRKMRNLMLRAGLVEPVPLVIKKKIINRTYKTLLLLLYN